MSVSKQAHIVIVEAVIVHIHQAFLFRYTHGGSVEMVLISYRKTPGIPILLEFHRLSTSSFTSVWCWYPQTLSEV